MRQPSAFRLSRLSFPALAAALILGAQALVAAPMTLTDILGRTIRAEPVSLNGDALKIRREDGREFTIELKSLVEDDQAKIRAWNTAQAQGDAFADAETPAPKLEKPKYAPDLTKISFSTSRFKGDTNTITKFEGYSHKHEMWGYSFQVGNRNVYPLENIRVEYNLYARTFSDSSTPLVVTGTLDLPSIDTNRFEGGKTKTAEVCKQKGIYTFNSGGELRGIWFKVYMDGKLIQEQILPESLKSDVEWTKPRSGEAGSQRRVIIDGHVY